MEARHLLILLTCLPIFSAEMPNGAMLGNASIDVDTWGSFHKDLDLLEAELADFSDKLSFKAETQDYEWKIETITTDLEQLTGTGCDRFSQFQCGFPQLGCVADYLVCDGAVDCPDGRDEDGCFLPFDVETSWIATAMPIYNNCLRHEPLENIIMGPSSDFTLEIMPDKILPSRPRIRGRWPIHLTSGRAWNWFVDGRYNYARRQFLLWWPYPIYYGHSMMSFDTRGRIMYAQIVYGTRAQVGQPLCALYNWQPRHEFDSMREV